MALQDVEGCFIDFAWTFPRFRGKLEGPSSLTWPSGWTAVGTVRGCIGALLKGTSAGCLLL